MVILAYSCVSSCDGTSSLDVASVSVPILTIIPLSVANAKTFKERLCDRVVNRFQDDQIMWQRVNDRIEKRFGYRCESIEEDEEAISNRKYDVKTWEDKKGSYKMITPPGGVAPEVVKTPKDRFYFLEERMEENMESWRALHQEMGEKMELFMEHYKAGGKEGVHEVNELEKKFITQYNKYYDIYNELVYLSSDLKRYWKFQIRLEIIQSIESKIRGIEKEFDKMPRVMYYY
jgi:hypothetical protein